MKSAMTIGVDVQKNGFVMTISQIPLIAAMIAEIQRQAGTAQVQVTQRGMNTLITAADTVMAAAKEFTAEPLR